MDPEERLEEILAGIERRAEKEKASAIRQNLGREWVEMFGLYQEGMNIYSYSHDPYVVNFYYKANNLLGLFWLFDQFQKKLRPMMPYCANEGGGRWAFPLSSRELQRRYDQEKTLDHDELGIYEIFPIWFELEEAHNQRGQRRAYYSRPAGFKAKFGFSTGSGPWTARLNGIKGFEIEVKFETWEPLWEIGLYYKGMIFDQEKKRWNWVPQYGKDLYLHPRMAAWEEIHYRGGHSYLFIPAGFVWANGMGWEEELLEQELERK